MTDLPSSISGFTVLPISYGPEATHILYARAHVGSKRAKSTSLPEGRTLFLVNVPPDATERELVLLFKHCGTVEKVLFDFESESAELGGVQSEDEDEEAVIDDDEEKTDDQPRKKRKVDKQKAPKVTPLPHTPLPHTPLRTLKRTGHNAHIVFLDPPSLDRALSSSSWTKKIRPWPTSTDEPSPGLAHYTALYDSLRPPLDAVREHADTYMEHYEYELAKTRQKSKYRKGEAVVDEDGFTLVVRGGAYGKTLGGGVAVASKKFQETRQSSGSNRRRGRPKKEKKEKEAFYGFQKTEKQRKELLDLKKNWEADKAKIEKLKESRRYKPY